MRAILEDLRSGSDAGRVASRFHRAVATVTARACEALATERAVETVVLSGGEFQNRLLTELTCELLADAGLEVLVPRRLPANDGGISFGQAAVAVGRMLLRA